LTLAKINLMLMCCSTGFRRCLL